MRSAGYLLLEGDLQDGELPEGNQWKAVSARTIFSWKVNCSNYREYDK
jgi:hypothetical protein